MPKDQKKKKDPKLRKLTGQQRRAVEYRAKPTCENNQDAVLHGYPKAKKWAKNTLQRFSSDLFRKPNVAYQLEKEYERIRAIDNRKNDLTADMIINEFRAIAMAKLTDVVQYTTKLNRYKQTVYVMTMSEFDKISDATKSAIKKMKIKTIPAKVDGTEDEWHEIQEIEFEMLPKQPALDSLAKYFNLYVEKLEVHHTGAVAHVHTTVEELRTLFESMNPDERAAHMDKLIDKLGGDDEE
jgi:hypothetical protein